MKSYEQLREAIYEKAVNYQENQNHLYGVDEVFLDEDLVKMAFIMQIIGGFSTDDKSLLDHLLKEATNFEVCPKALDYQVIEDKGKPQILHTLHMAYMYNGTDEFILKLLKERNEYINK